MRGDTSQKHGTLHTPLGHKMLWSRTLIAFSPRSFTLSHVFSSILVSGLQSSDRPRVWSSWLLALVLSLWWCAPLLKLSRHSSCGSILGTVRLWSPPQCLPTLKCTFARINMDCSAPSPLCGTPSSLWGGNTMSHLMKSMIC